MTLIQINDTLQDVAMMKYLMLILRIGLTHQVTDNLKQPQTLLHESSCLVKCVAWKSKPECILTVDRFSKGRKVVNFLFHIFLVTCISPSSASVPEDGERLEMFSGNLILGKFE